MSSSERRGDRGWTGSQTRPGSGVVGAADQGTQTLFSPPFHFLLSSNFSNYKARFSMPGNNEGLWYR